MAKICVALDVDPDRAVNLIEELVEFPVIFKVGVKLYLQMGREILERVKERDKEVFLDLKLHDIPNTVRLAVESARDLGVDYLTLHTLGGEEMMRKSLEISGDLNLVGVTILTSHDDTYLEFIKTRFAGVKDMVLHLAKSAQRSGISWVVCSAGELDIIKENTDLKAVVPGIRIGDRRDDQKRVFSPDEAVSRGADMIVMGRDIYGSDNPTSVVERVLERIGA